MRLSEYLRNRAFWALDRVRGGTVRRELQLMEKINSVPAHEIRVYQQQALQALLTHARETMAFYGKIGSNDLKDFPVITKYRIRQNREDFLSSAYDPDSLIPMSTSGSTGTPFTVLQDRTKKRSVYAEVLHYNGKVGYRVGHRLVYLRTINSENRKSPLQQYARNIYQVLCNDMSDQGMEAMLDAIRRLSRPSPVLLLGYGSTFCAMARFFDRRGRDRARGCRVYAIISSSEYLYDPARACLEETFHCPCVSRYANEENGFLGQDADENNVFSVNPAHYYYEVFKLEEDVPAQPGELGRLVITDLKNYGLPMIRYDTGDVGTLSDDGSGLQKIRNFSGRKIDLLFDTQGRELTGFGVVMWKYAPSIRQLQIIQTGPTTYRLRLNGENIPLDQVRETLLDFLGRDAQITFEMVDEIPVLASGKRRAVVNLWKNTPDGEQA